MNYIKQLDDNSEGGITVYSVACYLSQGLQVDVFAFKNDAYLYLVDQAEFLTDEQRIELGQLAEVPDREAFWTLFNESVSPLTVTGSNRTPCNCSPTFSRHEQFRIRSWRDAERPRRPFRP
jgi:hypothetical protein